LYLTFCICVSSMNISSEQQYPFQRKTPPLDLKHLRYAVAAADHGSFRSAADVLLVRQSTLSRSIRQLEHTIGMVVFDRSSGGIRATECGTGFLREARSILEQIDSLASSARMSGRGEAGRLRIGFYTSLSTGNLRATIVDYAKRLPKVEIGMFESSRNSLESALRNDVVDIAIVTGERGFDGLSSLPLWSERILVVLPETHRLAANPIIHWTDLKNETLILGRRDPGPAIQELLAAKVTSPEDRPRIVSYDISRESVKSLVGARFGVGLTLEASLGGSFEGVVHREIQDGSGSTRVSVCANWFAQNKNPALIGFLRLLKERYPSPTH
jgi:DNA-binding transcriptional LysR family regulator